MGAREGVMCLQILVLLAFHVLSIDASCNTSLFACLFEGCFK